MHSPSVSISGSIGLIDIAQARHTVAVEWKCPMHISYGESLLNVS